MYTCICRVYLTAEHSFAKPTHRIPLSSTHLRIESFVIMLLQVSDYTVPLTRYAHAHNTMHAPLSCSVSRPYYGFYEKKAPVATHLCIIPFQKTFVNNTICIICKNIIYSIGCRRCVSCFPLQWCTSLSI